jgi:hypothetical protein
MQKQHQSQSRRATAEERRFLDALCFLRALYAERGPQDSSSDESVAAVILAAEQRMAALIATGASQQHGFAHG